MKDIRELTKVNEESLPKLYCDMDQVLVAFLSGVKKITGQDFERMDRETRWKTISPTLKDFWANLDWMPGAKRLVSKDMRSIRSLTYYRLLQHKDSVDLEAGKI